MAKKPLGFISDEDMEKIEKKPSGFISDEDMEKFESGKDEEPLLKQLGRATVKQLPTIGAALGGTAGFFTPLPGGTLGGAAAGGAAGEGLRQVLEHRLFDDVQAMPIAERPGQILRQAALGAAGEGAGAVIGKGIAGLTKFPAKFLPQKKESAKAILEATRAIGAEPIPAQLTKSRTIRGLEQSLAESPTIAGSSVEEGQKQLFSAIDKSTQGLFKNAEKMTPFQAGGEFKNEIIEGVSTKLDPLSSTFDKVRESTKHIDLNPKSLDRVASNIEKIRAGNIVKGSSASSYQNQIAESVRGLKSADDVKELMSYINNELADGSLNKNAKVVLGEAKNKLMGLEENTIKRSAYEISKTEGPGVAQEILTDLKASRKGYAELLKDLKEMQQGAGLKKFNTPQEFINNLDKIPDEKIGEMFFNKQNVSFLNNLKEKYPPLFDKARNLKLAELAEKSTVKGELRLSNLVRETDKLQPEVKALLFDKTEQETLSNLKTVLNSLPEKLNPSGTSQAIDLQKVGSPTEQVKDALRLGTLKGLNKLQDKGIGEALTRRAQQIQQKRIFEGLLGPQIQTGLRKIREE